jgi:catechol 2,3-dioxygenase
MHAMTSVFPLAPDTALGPLRLTVADLPGVSAFYERVVGLTTLERDGELVRLGPAGGAVLVELEQRADAPPRARSASGLFHLALLVPSRVELARALRRIVGAGWPLGGASDHLVSEALYLADPEGNGIEIYRDRPRVEWPGRDGELEMATLPLDLDGLVAELPPGEDPASDAGMASGTTLGHVHLQVADLGPAERFYAETLGFEVMVRRYPGALFVAAGGYHHHVGLNTWSSLGGPPADPHARGLAFVTLALPDAEALAAVLARVRAAGGPVEEQDDGSVLATDPFGIAVRLALAPAPSGARQSAAAPGAA